MQTDSRQRDIETDYVFTNSSYSSLCIITSPLIVYISPCIVYISPVVNNRNINYILCFTKYIKQLIFVYKKLISSNVTNIRDE